MSEERNITEPDEDEFAGWRRGAELALIEKRRHFMKRLASQAGLPSPFGKRVNAESPDGDTYARPNQHCKHLHAPRCKVNTDDASNGKYSPPLPTSTPSNPPREQVLSFISPEPKVGDPSCSWEAFKNPKLRRFPKSDSEFQWVEYLGMGVDGLAIRANVDDEDVVVKIFWETTQREPEGGAYFYWAFERECCNCAVLESITTSLQRSLDEGKQIYIHPRPKTIKDARRNLKAFSAEYSGRQCRPGFVPFSLRTEINKCLGWTEVDSHDIVPFLRTCRVHRFPENKKSFAMVYPYIPMGKLDKDVVQSQLDFFYLLGFISVPMNLNNWRSMGILTDFSDLIFPYAPEWEQLRYGRKVYKKELGRWALEMPNFPREKSWPS